MEQMMNNIQCHRQAVRDNIMKSFGADFSDVLKAEENDLEKAHKVGDVHPNGKWVWVEYAPGKFDWRGRKDGRGTRPKAPVAHAPMKPVSKLQGQPQASQSNQQTSQKTYYAPKNAKIWLTPKSGGMDESFANLGGRGNGTKEREEYIKLIIRNASSAEELAKKLNDDSSIYGKWSVNKEGFVEGEDYNGNVSVIKWAVAPVQQSAQTAAKKN